MKELKDIVLKKGDIVYYINSYGGKSILCVDGYDGSSLKDFEKGGSVITKIERPTQYGTIYEAPKQILDKEEKEYLEVVLRPFKDRIRKLIKRHSFGNENLFVEIKHFNTDSNDSLEFPEFEPKTKYKGMEIDKEYTLDELGLFKE